VVVCLRANFCLLSLRTPGDRKVVVYQVSVSVSVVVKRFVVVVISIVVVGVVVCVVRVGVVV